MCTNVNHVSSPLLTHAGHCGKTMAIVDKFYSDASLSGRSWLIITDDDTLLRYRTLAPNPSMVNNVFLTAVSLDCADCWLATMPLFLFSWERFMVIRIISIMVLDMSLEEEGEGRREGGREVRGGSELHQSSSPVCFPSMVLSREAVMRMAGNGCPALDYPDDLFLGSTARRLGVHIVHSPLFHQVYTVYHSISQYTTVYHSIPQYTTVYHSISQYTTVYHSIPQYRTVYHSFTIASLPYSPSLRATLPLSLR